MPIAIEKRSDSNLKRKRASTKFLCEHESDKWNWNSSSVVIITHSPKVQPSPTRHAIVATSTYPIEIVESNVTESDWDVKSIIAEAQARVIPIDLRADDIMTLMVS